MLPFSFFLLPLCFTLAYSAFVWYRVEWFLDRGIPGLILMTVAPVVVFAVYAVAYFRNDEDA